VEDLYLLLEIVTVDNRNQAIAQYLAEKAAK